MNGLAFSPVSIEARWAQVVAVLQAQGTDIDALMLQGASVFAVPPRDPEQYLDIPVDDDEAAP